MALYLFDTDIFSLWAAGHPKIETRVQAQPTGDVATSVPTIEEALVGWLTALRRARTNDRRAIVYERMATTTSALARLTVLTCTQTRSTGMISCRK